MAILALLLVIYVTLQGCVVYKNLSPQQTSTNIFTSLDIYITGFEERIAKEPFSFEVTENTTKALEITCLAWLIVVLYIYSSKRKYIRGKEYGTARWASSGELRKLRSEYLMNEEIKKVRQSRLVFIRYFMEKKALKKCDDDGKKLKSLLLRELNEQVEALKENNSYDDEIYSAKKKEINMKVKEFVHFAKIESWKPYAIKVKYEESVKELEDKLKYRILKENEKEIELEKVYKEYKKSLHNFYYGKSRIRSIEQKYMNSDEYFTQTEKISIYNLLLNRNTLIVGGSGSGKTRGYGIPNILQTNSSFVITDPKSDILLRCGYFLSKVKGYKIHVLNLDNKAKSDGYNPFVYIRPEREGYEERILMLIETIIINTDGGEKRNSNDPFWDKAERLFLQSIFFFTCDGFELSDRNMNTVLALIAMLQIAEEEDKYDSDLDYYAKIFEREHGSEHIGVQQFKEFRSKASGKTAKSIVISAIARLAPFRTEAVRRIFSYDTMGLDRLGEEKTAIFIVVPPTDGTFNFIAGMVFSQMFQELQYSATEIHKREGQKLPVPVKFILDEFANTCTIPNFLKILAYARSFGIGISIIIQSLDQIKNMYKEEYGILIDNCDTLLYLGNIKHNETLEYMSKLLGKGTYDKKTTGRTKGRQGSFSTNYDVFGRELLDPSEIMKMPKEKCLLIVSGKNPFYSTKYDLTKHPNYMFTSDANESYLFDYNPPQKPKEFLPNNTETEKVITHGEFAKSQKELKPSKNTLVDFEEIKLNLDYAKIANKLGRSLRHYIPIPDSFFNVNGTEEKLTKEENEIILGFLTDKETKDEADRMFSLSSKTMEVIEKAEDDEIKIDTNVYSIAHKITTIGRYLAPIPDKLFGAEELPVLSEEQNTIIFEEIENSELESNLNDIKEMSGGVINDLIDDLPIPMRDIVIQT
ncbi:MAG: type IV secretory system conjugative DNA transfer family protein [Oscillospiraceae bacterium]|nr:type IV secretory system conjugative DNA transfer family protein [Oscillospiraceae bacterium]